MSDDRSEYLRTHFLRRVAHDIRGPSGVTLTALDELAIAQGTDAAGPLLQMAKRGVRRLTRLADRLSMTAEMERGSVDMGATRGPFDLREVTKRATRDAEELAGRRGVTLSFEAGEHAAMASLDPRWIEHALYEVTVNALRFAKANVRTRIDGTTVSIEDDGPGFPAGEPWTGRFSIREGVHGLGLSLALAHDALALHGGSLTFGESTLAPGRGTKRGALVVATLPPPLPIRSYGAAKNGSVNSMRVPRVSVSARIVPPCARTMPRATKSPS